MSNKTRVFVTGLGVISPVGNTVDEMWASIRNGVSGIGRITRFDPSRVDAKIAAEVGRRIPLNETGFAAVMRTAEGRDSAFKAFEDEVAKAEGDLAKARLVLERDAEIDALNRKNYEELFGRAGDAAKVSASHVELIFISKALERIGDHSKNIAEQVIFLLSGEDVRHAR